MICCYSRKSLVTWIPGMIPLKSWHFKVNKPKKWVSFRLFLTIIIQVWQLLRCLVRVERWVARSWGVDRWGRCRRQSMSERGDCGYNVRPAKWNLLKKITITIWKPDYSGGSNTEQVRYSDGQKMFGPSPNHLKTELR